MDKNDWFFYYLPVSDEVIRRGLYLTSAGRQHTKPHGDFPPEQHPLVYHFKWTEGRRLPEFALVLFTEGRGEFESEKAGPQSIQPDEVVLITPGQWHRYRPDPETGYTERWICFSGEIPHDLLDRGLLEPTDMVVGIQHPAALIAQFDTLLKHVRQWHSSNPIATTHHTMALLGTALAMAHRDQEKEKGAPPPAKMVASDPLVSEALDLIWTRSHGTLEVIDIVAKLPASRRTLERRFEAVLGYSILDEINTCRLHRAKRLLSETNLIMKRVAYLSGFSCADRMRLTFLRYANLTPSEYRQKTMKPARD